MSEFLIVGLGGSSGSFGPLTVILEGLPRDFSGAVLITVHRHPDSDSYLSHLMARKTVLPVRQAEHREVIEPGTIYVAPPGMHLIVFGGRIVLSPGPRENHARPAIDVMFRSLAVDSGSRAIAILLSGLLSDGVSGLSAVARCGGVTMVQDPSEAEFKDMPLRALEALVPDHCLSAQGILSELKRITSEAPRSPSDANPPADLRAELDIAMMNALTIGTEEWLGKRSNVSCPDCGGVLWEIEDKPPLRFRCHTGHAFAADVLAHSQAEKIEEAMWSAMRALREQAETFRRLSDAADTAEARGKWTNQARAADANADRMSESIAVVAAAQSKRKN